MRMLVDNVVGIIFGRGNRDAEILMTIDDVMAFIPEQMKLKSLITEIKQIFGGGDSNSVTGAELQKILSHAEKMLMGAVVSHRIYDKYRMVFESPLPLELNYEEAVQAFPEYREELKTIARVLKENRFMKGEFEVPYFTTEIRRNADAFAETYISEYILREVFRKYGKQGSMDQMALQNLVKKFERELIEFGVILPRSSAQFTDFVTLLGSSDGKMEVNKTAVFVSFFQAGSDVAETLTKEISKKCDADMDEFGRVGASCFKKEFMTTLCNSYGSQFKLLCENQSSGYLQAMTKLARTCNVYANKEEIPFSESEVGSLATSIMHVEAIMIKYDANKNNILDAVEAEKAYEELSPVLDAFIAGEPKLKSYKKKIYAYVLKFGKYPDVKSTGGVARFLKFLVSFNTKPHATRESLANLLGETRVLWEAQRTEENSGFNCEYMKDPENIPYEA
jgi:hypothetical protein